MRPSRRAPDQLREISFQRHYTKHAEGSVLVAFGETKVICTASVVKGVPRFLKGQGQAWLTAEYGMLPRATGERTQREAARGGQSGRTQEIQRLIGRSLRAVTELKFLPEYTIHLDCDVIQADGGTRTAAISGCSVALADALKVFKDKKLIPAHIKTAHPLKSLVAAVSVGIFEGQPVLDLDYAEDSNASTDMNVMMDDQGRFIEIQGTAEETPYTDEELQSMLALARHGAKQIIQFQRQALGLTEKEKETLAW